VISRFSPQADELRHPIKRHRRNEERELHETGGSELPPAHRGVRQAKCQQAHEDRQVPLAEGHFPAHLRVTDKVYGSTPSAFS
jgi:hypothetical protein